MFCMIKGVAKASLKLWIRNNLENIFSHPLAQRALCVKRITLHALSESSLALSAPTPTH